MDLEKRIASYLDKVPPSVAGQQGDTQLFKVACTLYNGFALAEEETLKWLHHFNKKCQPPWNEDRLAYKAGQAAQVSHQNPRGYLLGMLPKPTLIEDKPIREFKLPATFATAKPDSPPNTCYDITPTPSINTPVLSVRVGKNSRGYRGKKDLHMGCYDPVVKTALELFDGELRPATPTYPWAMWDKLAKYDPSWHGT
jgi:hypothetical protein